MSSPSPIKPPAGTPAKRFKWRRWFARAAFTLAVFTTLMAGWYAIERIRGRASWERYEVQARAAGVKLDMAQYVPPPVPDADNFAAIPLFQEAFQALAEGRPAARTLEWPSVDGVKRPPMANVATGKPIDLAAWQSYFVGAKMIPAAGGHPARDVLEALKKFDPELAQLREAGQRPGCHFPVRWEDGIYAAMPHVSLMNTSAQIFALRLAAHLALGENEAAYEDFRNALRVYTATVREPTLIAALVRQTIPSTLANAVWDGIARRQWQDADLALIEKHLRAVNTLADYELGMGSERAISSSIYKQLRSMNSAKNRNLFSIMYSMGESHPGGPWVYGLLSLYPQGWVYRNQERSNRYFDDLMARVSINPPRLHREMPTANAPENLQGAYDRYRFFFFALSAPVFQTLELRFGNTQVLTDQARLACALERFRIARGSLPAQLAELTPEFIPSIPADVMSGQPYHYRPAEGGSYVLYSVAGNLQDDGGQTGPETAVAKQLDWVWKMPGAASAK